MDRRIQTTHVGSLPRPQQLLEAIVAKDRGGAYDEAALVRDIEAAVDDIVAKQIAAGVDSVSDGEMSKVSYTNYIKHRIDGFGGKGRPLSGALDLLDNPEFAAFMARNAEENPLNPPDCIGPLSIKDRSALEADLANFGRAVNRHKPAHSFMNAASPGVISMFMQNAYYPSDDAYVEALAEVLQDEYEAIIDAGFELQIDAPDLAMGRHTGYKDLSMGDFRARAEKNVEALNHATRNIAPEKMRLHLCWGNYPGPHNCDIGVGEVIDIVVKARPQTLLFEAANPRHAHEHKAWADKADLIPDDKILCPGVLDTNTNCIEHPELVAERLVNFANIVGGDRVMAGTDCGFSTVADRPRVFPSLVWRKLESQRQGADLAAKQIWG